MPGNRNHDFREVELHALIRLAGELGELNGDILAKRRHCLAELCRLCNADKAVFGEFGRDGRSGLLQASLPTVLFYNTPENERRRLMRFYDRNEPVDPVIEHLGQLNESIAIGRPGDFIGERTWRASPHFNVVRRPAAVIEQIYAFAAVDRVACAIGLHRRDARPFQKRELRLMEAFMRGAGRSLHAAAAPNGPPIAQTLAGAIELPPRLTAVLNRFLLGETEKQAAEQIGVTHHTVHSYAKQLYRRLGVSSRSELLARYIPKP